MSFFILIGMALIIGGIVLVVQGVQTQRGQLRSLGGATIIAGAAVAFLSSAFVIVPPGNVGVVFNIVGGVEQNERPEGLRFVLPLFQSVTVMNVREQTVTFANETNDAISALSKEGLQIETDSTIRFRIRSSEASKIFQEVGTDYTNVLIRPKARSAIRDAIANFNAAELISTQRTTLQLQIKEVLTQELADADIELLDVLLRDIRIPEAISQAIEEKQAAEQQVQVEANRREQSRIAAERRVIEAQGERDSAIAKAEGEAQALTLRGQAIRENPEIIQLEIAQKLAPSLQTILLPSDGNFLLDVRGLTNGNATPQLP